MEVIIRPYEKKDRQAVRNIAFDTALLGEPASAFFDDQEVFSDFLTQYFLDFEPQSCFVAEYEKQVIGYCMGAEDARILEKTFKEKIFAKLLWKAISRNVHLKKKSLVFAFNSLISLLRGEFKQPDFSQDYPATLHINIHYAFRSMGIGSQLMKKFLGYLAQEKVKGVHLATLSDQAAHFYEKIGFILLHQGKRSYLRNILGKELTCYIFGKKIN